ncbi:MAG: hypothetical protein KDA24_19060 [Deltaproteobacteria bacterium]|nr:hypothetical protein [Deltaproteobacteria bacterium]
MHTLPPLLALLFCLVATPAFAGPQWAVGDGSLPELDALASAIDKAITKAGPKAPAFKKGPELRVLVTCTEAGCSPSVTQVSNIAPEQVQEVLTWARKWILPVTTPGLAMSVRVWWGKPRKGEKKEKLKAGQQPTKPPPGLYWSVGFEPSAVGPLPLDEVLRAERLVFSSAAQVCSAEVSAMRVGHGSTTLWHVDIAASGSIQATPQDQYVPPPDPKEQKKEQAAAAGAGAAGAFGLEAPAVEAPEGAPAAELPAIGAGGIAIVPRELTALETCLQFKLATARYKGGGDGPTSVDRLPVTVVP